MGVEQKTKAYELAFLMAYYYACGRNDALNESNAKQYVSPSQFADSYGLHVARFKEGEETMRSSVQDAFAIYQQVFNDAV